VAREKMHSQITDESQSALRRYQRLIVGSTRLGYTLKYELIVAIGSVAPGALGLWLRQKLYRRLLMRAGRGVFFGAGVILRHPCKVAVGDHVVVADGCLLDARGDSNRGIRLGDNVILGDRATLRCKDGDIVIGNNVGIGLNSSLSAVGGNVLELADEVMIGPYAYLGGASYHHDRLDIPISHQGQDLKGGIKVGYGAWIGARAVIMDGVTIGRDAIVATNAVVNKDVPDYAIVAGVPARLVRTRRAEPVQAEVESPDPPIGLHCGGPSDPMPVLPGVNRARSKSCQE
jgi:acetyltransferase-like isoleucine patch superfamily enzyme